MFELTFKIMTMSVTHLPDSECVEAKLAPAKQRGSGDQGGDEPDGHDGDQGGEGGAQRELPVLGDHHEPREEFKGVKVTVKETEIGNLFVPVAAFDQKLPITFYLSLTFEVRVLSKR